jgi:hypothetical protein
MPIATRRDPVTPKKAGQPPAVAPVPQRTYLLEVPFEMRALPQASGARWDQSLGAFVFKGVTLPDALAAYHCETYSWGRFREDEINGVEPSASVPERQVRLRQHQMDCVRAARSAIKAGRTGFLIADDVGLGKTIETWATIMSMKDAETVLVVCPLAVVAHWRRTIRWMGDCGKRIVVINYDRYPV